MKFKEYVQSLVTYLDEHPETSEFTTIYATDDEGNGFQKLNVDEPLLGNFEWHSGEFVTYQEDLDFFEMEVNAVCIN